MKAKRIVLTETLGQGLTAPNLDIDLNGFASVEEALVVLRKTVLILEAKVSVPAPVLAPQPVSVDLGVFAPLVRS